MKPTADTPFTTVVSDAGRPSIIDRAVLRDEEMHASSTFDDALRGNKCDLLVLDDIEESNLSHDGQKKKSSKDFDEFTPCQETTKTELSPMDEATFSKTLTKSAPSPGWRFRRPTGWVQGESLRQRQERFWKGIKLPRKTSEDALQPIKLPRNITMVTMRAALKLKERAIAFIAKSTLSKTILDPHSARMQLWKNWMLVNIMYTVLDVPWRISFDSRGGVFALVLSSVANMSFVVDTILHFFTAVKTDTGIVVDQREISRRYLSSWFVIDVVSCVPFTTLLRDYVAPSLRVLTPMRGLRLLSLLKVAKVYALHYEVSPVAMSIGKTLVTVILAAHLLSCLWFWVSCHDALKSDPKPWEQCGSSDSAASQYLSSFYFIIYTMMTVGYGDQHADASSTKGLLLSVMIQLTGATLFGFIIAATRRIVQFIAPIQKATAANIQKISGYAVDRRLPPGVSSRMKRHFRYFYFKTSVFDENTVMGHVSWELCHNVVVKTHSVALSAAGLLQNDTFSPSVLIRLARAMKPMELDTREEPIRQGDVVLQVFFVIMGRIEAYVRDTPEVSESISAPSSSLHDGSGIGQGAYLGVWGPGSLWGLNNVVLGGWSEATFVAASQSDLLWLDQADLFAAMEEHPEIRPCFEKIAERDRDVDSVPSHALPSPGVKTLDIPAVLQTRGQALIEAIGSDTITKEGLRVKQTSLTDFKGSDLKQQLKHTDVNSLCSVASAEKAALAHGHRAAAGGGVAGMVQDFQQMAASSGRGVKGRVKDMMASIKTAFGGTTRSRTHMRLVRTWRAGSHGFGEVHDWMGRTVKGVMETEETPEELNRRLMVLPDQPHKLRWDAGISMVCVLVAVLTPFRIAFAGIASKRWMVFDETVDALFVVDILLRLRTAYVASAANNIIVYITVPGMIIKHYLRGCMILDIASTLPSYLLGLSDKYFRALGVLKLLRVGRVAALSEQLHRLSEQEVISSGGSRPKGWLRGIQVDVSRWCIDVAQILIVIIYASHIFGCLWWVTSRYDDGQRSWWGQDGLDIDDTMSTYIASIYWAATTITTVGYGDITPTNDLERAVACLTMVCGTTMFSYVIGSVSTLVMNPTEGNVRRNLEMMNVKNYLEEQRVREHLSSTVKSHMVFTIGARSAWNEDRVLSRIPPKIRERIVEHIHRDAVECIPIFKSRPPGFVCAILRNLRPQQYSQGEIIYKDFRMSQGVYFVTKGIAEAYVKETVTGGEVEERVKSVMGPGKIFGYTRFLAAFLDDDMSIRAFTVLHLYLLSNNSIQHLLHYHPFLAEELRNALEQTVFDQASHEMSFDEKKCVARESLNGERKASADSKRPTSALTTYLRRVSVKPPRATMAIAHSHEDQPRVASEGNTNAADIEGEKQGVRNRLQFLTDTPVVEFSDSSTNGSDKDSSTTAPGITGGNESELTRGSNICGKASSGEGLCEMGEAGMAAGGRHPMASAAAAAAGAVTAVERNGSDATPAEMGGTHHAWLPRPEEIFQPGASRASLYTKERKSNKYNLDAHATRERQKASRE